MLEKVERALAAIQERGTFASRATAMPTDLSIEVKDAGKVTLPVSPMTARKLRRAGRQAGYGWRDKTFVDKSVRDTWEIARSRVKIDQRKWRKTLEPELERIKHELGLPAEGKLVARLHKMLVYETGQFFSPHQDSEKTDDMVATLSVVLPSAYKGGAVVIEHSGETVTFRRLARSAEQLTFIAFYADCHHEVRPVTEGYRVVQQYSLMFNGPVTASPVTDDDPMVGRLAEYVGAHFATPAPVGQYSESIGEAPDKLVYLLDHDYTRKSLAWNHLKSADRVRAGALGEVAERLDCEVFLALAEVHETWAYEEDGYDWGFRSHRDDDSDDGEVDPDSVALTELLNSEIELRHWVDVAGKAVEGIPTDISWNEVCDTRASVELEPFRSEHEGWMGNYGNTADRWHHRAAVVMWPRSKSFAIRAKVSPAWAVDQLDKAVKAGSLPEARDKARLLVPFWRYRAAREEKKPFFEKTLRVARGVEDRDLAASLLGPFRLNQAGARAMPHVAALVEIYGLAWSRDGYLEWEAGGSRYDRESEWLEFMPTFCRMLSASGTNPARKLGQWVVSRQWAALKEQSEKDLEDPERPHTIAQLAVTAKQMIRVLESCVAVEEKGVHATIVAYLTSDGTSYPAMCIATALRDARKRHTPKDLRALGLGSVRSYCLSRLSATLAAPPRNAGDWSIASPMKCKCELCRTLGQFLTSRDQNHLQWPLAQAKRAHVHGQLDSYDLPVSHVTKRTGRPYKLVLVKTKVLFARESELRKSLKRGVTWLNQQRRAFV